MILAVCLNAALDVTYQLPGAHTVGASHRVVEVHERAGGKAVNVARVLRQLGEPVRVLGFAGGDAGAALSAELEAEGVDARWVPTVGATRRTVAVVDAAHATVFNEPGPIVTHAEWLALVERFDAELSGVALVVLSGSLPPGVPVDGYGRLTERAVAAGVRVLIDAEGPALGSALKAGPYLVKPNVHELAATIGRPLDGAVEIAAAAAELLLTGAENAVISCGADGLIAVTGDRRWRAVSDELVQGNPTGAGDALVAALAAGLVRGSAWPELLAEGIAVSAAAVAVPVAGGFDPATRERVRAAVVVTGMTGTDGER